MHYYNILDLARVRSEVPLRELNSFRTRPFDGREDIVVRCRGGFRSGPRFDRGVLDGKHSLSYVEHLGSLGATVLIESKERIDVEVNWILKYSNAVLYVNVIEPLLRLVLAEKGFALLHGASLSRKDKAVILSAPPDTGKTTTVLKCLIRAWFSFMSDDMTILGPDRTVYSFPKPFTISAHTYASLVSGDLKTRGLKNKLKLRIKSYVHSRTGRRVLRLVGELNLPILTLNAIGQMVVRPPKIFVEDLVRNVTVKSTAEAVAVCLLRKRGEKVAVAGPDETLEELLFNSEDAFGFPPYSEIFHKLTIKGKTALEILREEKRLLQNLASSVECFRLHSDSRNWDLMVNQIMDEILAPVTPMVETAPVILEPAVPARR